MEVVNDAITNGLLQLFKNKLYIPRYPFKTLVQCMLRDEASEGVSQQQVTDYASIPSEEMHLQIKMVLFGDSTFVGTKHLVKLISANSVREMKPMAEYIRTVFGNQVAHTKTDRIEANFIEVYLVNSCLGLALVKPRQHRLEMIVEVVIKGRIDECINLFIRRILEEAHMSETSEHILTSSLTATIRGVTEEINVYTMREKRQLVVNSLKAAVLDEGDICLECYVRTCKNLLSYGDSSTKSIESTEGFTLLRRWYKLSYRDETDPANPAVRCFAQNPLQSVALGVFSSLKDADMYLKVLAEHLKRMKSRSAPTGEKADPAVASGENATFMLNNLVNTMCTRIVTQLEDGELSDAGESMLMALGLMTCQRTGLSHAMQQVRRITHSSAAHIRAVRDAMATLQASLQLLSRLVQQSPAVLNQLRGNALNERELEQLTKINAIYAAFTPAVKQIRAMLLELLSLNQYSELQYLAPHIMSLLWQLFDPVSKAQPLLSPDAQLFREKGVASVVGLMRTCGKVLHRISAVLHMVELTAGTEVFISTIKQDLISYKSFAQNAAMGISGFVSRNRDHFGPEGDGESLKVPILHTFRELPKCLSDLIGYSIARSEFVARQVKHVLAGNYTELVWTPASVSHVLRRQLLPDEGARRSHRSAASGKAGDSDADAADRRQLQRNAEAGMERLEHLWDFYALLGEYNVPRLGGVDFRAALKQEWDRYDIPRFMCMEGVKLRYLTNTHVTRAMHEGLYDIITGPTMRPPLPALCKHLFKFPTYLSLWNNVGNETIQDFIMQPARCNWIHQLTANSGLHIVKLRDLPENIRLFISGGVLGSDRVLSGLGAHIEKVFLNAWQIPPLFATPPASRAGMHIKVYTGVTLTTAAEWCRPRLHRLQAASEKQRARRKRLLHPDNVVDHSLLAPTAVQVEKKRLFSLFSGGKPTPAAGADSSAEAKGGNGDDEDELDFAGINDYPSSDEEVAQTESSSKLSAVPKTSSMTSVRGGARAAAGVSANGTGARSGKVVDADTGVLETRGEVELEAVVRISYESSALLDQVRSAFAREVSNSCRYMQECHDWKLLRVVAHRDGEKTCDFGTKTENKSSVFPAADLGHPGNNAEQWAAMEEMVGKCGTAVLEAGMLFPDADSCLSKQQILAVFEKIIHRTAVSTGAAGQAAASTAPGGAAAASTPFFSADFQDIKGSSAVPASQRVDGSALDGLNSGKSARSTVMTPLPAKKHDHPFSIHEDEVTEEQNQMLDPTFSDIDRICRDSFVRKLLQQELLQGAAPRVIAGAEGAMEEEQGAELAAPRRPVRVYVPCRIRFTLLAQLNPRMSWGTSVMRSQGSGMPRGSKTPQSQAQTRPQEHYSVITGHQDHPLTIGSDHVVARLLSSTLWLSVEAARSIWSCAKDGEAQCILHEGKQRHIAYHRCVAQGLYCQAYQHVLVSSLLTQNYRLAASVNRAFGAVVFKFRRLVDVLEVCRQALSSDNTSFDITAVAMTVARHVCLGYRYVLTSSQVAHLRGGCAYLLKGIKRVETLLQLAAIPTADAMTALPRLLCAPDSTSSTTMGDGAGPATRDASATKATSAGAVPPSAIGTGAGDTAVKLKVKPDDKDFEAGLALGIRRAQANEQWVAKRMVAFEPPPPTGAILPGPPPGLNSTQPSVGAGTGTGGSALKGAADIATEGENYFRRAIAQQTRLRECLDLMLELEGMSRGLLLVLSEDMHANFPDVVEAMSQKTAAATAQELIPAAVRSLGLPAGAEDVRGSVVPGGFPPPNMVSSLEGLDWALGKDCSIEALVSYIHRAETPVNVALSDPEFERHIHNAATVMRFKVAKADVLSEQSQDRLSDLRKIAEISQDLTEEEKLAVKEIVFSSALAPSKSKKPAESAKGIAGAKNTESARPEAAQNAPAESGKSRIHRTATMRFRAGAEVIKLLAEGASLQKLAALQHARPAIEAAVEGSEHTASTATIASAASVATPGSPAPPAGTTAPGENLKKLHKVSSMVMEMTQGKKGKGIASLLKKMNMQVNSQKAEQSAAPADGGPVVLMMTPSGSGVSLPGRDAMSPGGARPPGGSMSGIHNMVDAIFKKRSASEDAAAQLAPGGEPNLSLAPSFASLATVSSLGSLGTVSEKDEDVENFYRAPIAFSLTRFHDEALQREQAAAAAMGVAAMHAQHEEQPLLLRTSPDFLRESDVSDASREDVLLSSMYPTGGDHAPIPAAPPAAPLPPAARVFQQAERLSAEGSSMLHLLRACIQQDTAAMAQLPEFDSPVPVAPRGFEVLHSPDRSTMRGAEARVEPGGMLDALRRRPKPDYQANHEVYF